MKRTRWTLLMILILAFICAGSFTTWTGEQLQVKVELIYTLAGPNICVHSVAFSPDGQLLSSRSCSEGGEAQCGKSDSEITLWDVTTGREERSLTDYDAELGSIAFSPDGQLLAAASCGNSECIQGAIKLWEVATGREIRTLRGHTDNVFSVAFSPDGKLLASGSRDDTIKLWEVATGREIRTLRGHTDWVWSVAFSPDGKLLASGSTDNTIKLWEVATGKLVRTLTGHSGTVWSVAFSPDGRLLASGSCSQPNKFPACTQGELKLWDVAAGREARTLIDDNSRVESVAFSPDGQLLASGSCDWYVSGWDIIARGGIKLWEIQVVENQPPQARFTYSPSQPVVGQSVRFDASASSDPDGTITSYAWDFGDGSTGSGRITTHTYDRSGTFTVTLTVTDDDGATDSTSRTITVTEANKPPRADFTFSPEKPLVGQSVTFDASASSDPDGHIVLYEWNFGDGSGKNYGMIVTHIFTKEGTYTVKLTVTDDDGASASIEKEVKVLESGGGGGPA